MAQPDKGITLNLPTNLTAGKYIITTKRGHPNKAVLHCPDHPSMKTMELTLQGTQVPQASLPSSTVAVVPKDSVRQASLRFPSASPCVNRQVISWPRMMSPTVAQGNSLHTMPVSAVGAHTIAVQKPISITKVPVCGFDSQKMSVTGPISEYARMTYMPSRGTMPKSGILSASTKVQGVDVQQTGGACINRSATAGAVPTAVPIQVNTGSDGPITTPIQLGAKTYLPVGIPVGVPPAKTQVTENQRHIPNHVASAYAITGLGTAVPFTFQPSPASVTQNKKQQVILVDGNATRRAPDPGSKFTPTRSLGSDDSGINFTPVTLPLEVTTKSNAGKEPRSEGHAWTATAFLPPPTWKTRTMMVKKPMPRSIMTHVYRDTEGLAHSLRLLVDDGQLQPAMEEVYAPATERIPNRGRDQNYKIDTIFIRDRHVHFRKDLLALQKLELRNRVLAAASSSLVDFHFDKEEVGNIDNLVEPESDSSDLRKSYLSNENAFNVSDRDEDASTSKAKIKMTNRVITDSQDDNSDRYNGPLEQGSETEKPEWSDCGEERESRLDEVKHVYKKMLAEQEQQQRERKLQLDQLLDSQGGRDSMADLVSGLLENMPSLVEDPLSEESNSAMYYCCYLCPFASFQQAKVCVHWTTTHLQQTPYVCGLCPAAFSASGQAHRHMLLAHPGCPVLIKLRPSAVFSNPLQLIFVDDTSQLLTLMETSRRLLSAHASHRLVCKECSFTAAARPAMHHHVRQHHLNLPAYACAYCNERFTKMTVLLNHTAARHTGMTPQPRVNHDMFHLLRSLRPSDFYTAIPPHRPVVFSPPEDYWTEDERENGKTALEGGKRFMCTRCAFSCHRADQIWQHVRLVHALPVGVYCRRCSNYQTLTSVERANEFFVCYQCYSLTSLRLNNELRCVPLLSAFRCLRCDHQSTDHLALKKHVRTAHLAVLPYSCKACSLKFSTRPQATAHCRGHHGFNCVDRNSLLVAKADRKASRLITAWLYVEPGEHNQDLADLWQQHGSGIVHDHSEKITLLEDDKVNASDTDPKDTDSGEGPTPTPGMLVVQYSPCLPARQHGSQNGGPYQTRRSVTANEGDFMQSEHFRCQVCNYRCSDRSCMSRHVKYMHLRIHPHSCPVCGYSNVEKTKVKIHICNLHGDHEMKVKTNTTLVSALGEESKKHFVRVLTSGEEIAGNNLSLATSCRGRSRRLKQRTLPEDGLANVKLEPVESSELLQLQDLPDSVTVKQERLDDSYDYALSPVMHIQRPDEEMDVDMTPVQSHRASKRKWSAGSPSALYSLLTVDSTLSAKRRRRAGPGQSGQQDQASHSAHDRPSRVYPDQQVMTDPKLTMLPVVIMEDIVRSILSGGFS